MNPNVVHKNTKEEIGYWLNLLNNDKLSKDNVDLINERINQLLRTLNKPHFVIKGSE